VHEETERFNARVRKQIYVSALNQAEADLRKGVEETGRRLALKRLVRSLRAVIYNNEQEGGSDGMDEGDSH
jgi:hypothetical protein